MRRGGTLVTFASRSWLISIGCGNSSRRISPKWIAACFLLAISTSLVVVGELDVVRVPLLSSEADTPLIFHADALLPGSISGQPLQPGSSCHTKVT